MIRQCIIKTEIIIRTVNMVIYFYDETCFHLKTSPILIFIRQIHGEGIGNKIEKPMLYM